jgi:hypothetical protein
MSTSLLDLPVATIEKALAIRKEIEALQTSLHSILGGVKESVTPTSPAVITKKADGRKGKRSPAARARMAAAQKARWAKKNGASTKAAPVEAVVSGAKKKRFVSPEARAKMAAAQKARWAKKNGASTKAAPVQAAVNGEKKKRFVSPEARAKMAAAQRARWAKKAA